ncbi:MAG: hypothetical protein RIS44_3047, partial [Pseudomonadota bacterium]
MFRCKNVTLFSGGIALCLALFLTACTTTPVETRTPEQIVQERAVQRWQAMIRGDVAAAYEYVAPSIRSVVTFERFKGSIGGAVQWVGVEPSVATCS